MQSSLHGTVGAVETVLKYHIQTITSTCSELHNIAKHTAVK